VYPDVLPTLYLARLHRTGDKHRQRRRNPDSEEKLNEYVKLLLLIEIILHRGARFIDQLL